MLSVLRAVHLMLKNCLLCSVKSHIYRDYLITILRVRKVFLTRLCRRMWNQNKGLKASFKNKKIKLLHCLQYCTVFDNVYHFHWQNIISILNSHASKLNCPKAHSMSVANVVIASHNFLYKLKSWFFFF